MGNKYVSQGEIARLAEIHVNRFIGRLNAGERGAVGIKMGECRYYLDLWIAIREKGSFSRLNSTERQELIEAVESGE